MELVATNAAAGLLGNQELQFDTLEHLVIKKIDLSLNKMGAITLSSIQALLKDLEEFKE